MLTDQDPAAVRGPTALHKPSPKGDARRAIAQETFGSADVLELRDIDQPEIGPDGVLGRTFVETLTEAGYEPDPTSESSAR